MKKERQEAIRAGERSFKSLRDAVHYLGGARLWGIVDLFGGGLSVILKHLKIRGASRSQESAKINLWAFQKKLRDARSVGTLDIDIEGLIFTGFFPDGLVADS